MLETRDAVKEEDKWNVAALYSSYEEWESSYEELVGKKNPWEELLSFQGHLGETPQILLQALRTYLSLSRRLEQLFTYAHLRHDEDIVEEQAKNCYERIVAALFDFKQQSAWFEPEILSLPDDVIKRDLESADFADYRFYLERLFRLRKHTLSQKEEKIIAAAMQPLQTAHNAFSSLSNADFKFPSVVDSKGATHELTHGLFRFYLRNRDRTLRQNTFTTYNNHYLQFENTLGNLLHGQIQGHIFFAKSHNYNSCLEAALKPNNIPLEVYHSLIKAVHDNISSLHRYVSLRKKLLGYDALKNWDLYVPLTKELEIQMDYAKGEQIVIDSVEPLGAEYQHILKEGLQKHRWVDRYENKNKRQGAYSSGCYDSYPYILMNYRGLLDDVFTLAHEAGHSMHSYLSRHHQPYHYGDYPIFVAEVASTFNEELLMRCLMKEARTTEEKIYLICEKLDDIYGTLFRQTLFAEFEMIIHKHVEERIPLTPALLKEEFYKLCTFYFGNDMSLDPTIAIEWARIPHFYYNFYVYQYATGISAALALANKVLSGGSAQRDQYLQFLKSGCSHYPIDLLRTAGVDMTTPEPVAITIGRFDELLKELEKLTS